MSDFNPYLPPGSGGPSPKAIEGLGDAATNFIAALNGKLENAEYTLQVNKAQEYMQRQVADFNLQRASDPDWQHYGDKWDEFRWKLENDVVGENGFVNNRRAKQDVTTWWSDAREKQRENIDKLQYNARVAQAQSTFTNLVELHRSDVAQGRENPDQADAAIRKSGDVLVSTNIVSSKDMQTNYMQVRKANELAYLRWLANDTAAKSGDWMAGIDVVDQHMSDPMFGHLDPSDFNSIRQDVVSWQRIREAEANKKADENNQKLDAQVDGFIIKNDFGGAMSFLADNQNNYLGTVGDKAEAGITMWRNSYKMVQEAERDFYSTQRRAIADRNINPEYIRIHNEIIGPTPDWQQIRREIVNGSVGHLITPDMGDHLLLLMKPEVTDKSKEYEADFSEQARLAKDPGVAAEFRTAQGIMRDFVAQHSQFSDTQFSDAKKVLMDKARHNIALDQVDTVLKEMVVASGSMERPRQPVSQGATPNQKLAAEQPPASKAPKAPDLGVFTKEKGYQYTDSNGVQWALSKGKAYWWDGKAWQTAP